MNSFDVFVIKGFTVDRSALKYVLWRIKCLFDICMIF